VSKINGESFSYHNCSEYYPPRFQKARKNEFIPQNSIVTIEPANERG
jgi:hypothetical protein